jgi:hypothetical protein
MRFFSICHIPSGHRIALIRDAVTVITQHDDGSVSVPGRDDELVTHQSFWRPKPCHRPIAHIAWEELRCAGMGAIFHGGTVAALGFTGDPDLIS